MLIRQQSLKVRLRLYLPACRSVFNLRMRKESFIEYCPICWERMERQGTLNGKAFYICTICGMATDGSKDNGHGTRADENRRVTDESI